MLAEWGLGESTVQMIVDYSLKIAGALLVLCMGMFVGRRVQSFIIHRLGKFQFDASLTKFFGQISRWGVLLLSFLACLSIFGVETTSFAAVIGGASVAIGLALQGSLSHVASGVMLLIFRPFTVGDVIKVAGEVGAVFEIGLFAVTLDTPDNRRVIVPNGAVFGSTIENITHHPIRRVGVDVGVDYDADIDATREVLMKAIANVDGVITNNEDFEPSAYLTELAGSSVNWNVRVFCNTEDYWAVRQDLTREVKIQLDAANIGIPYPQLVVHKPAA